MAERRVIVCPRDETGGRRVMVDDETIGTAHSLHDLSVFLERAGLEGWDEVDVAETLLIEWHAGGPEVWSATPEKEGPCALPRVGHPGRLCEQGQTRHGGNATY
ncbi:hypothetical protein ACWGQ5_47845 [Streptomyces sp. NPDC055722]